MADENEYYPQKEYPQNGQLEENVGDGKMMSIPAIPVEAAMTPVDYSETTATLDSPSTTTPQMAALVKRLRNKIMDNDPLMQILNNYQQEFSDDQLEGWITEAWYAINETEPETSYPLETFPKTALLLEGSVLQMCEGKGFLHLRNQISYNDAGFSVNLDDKSGVYAQWLAQLAQTYFNELTRFKRRPPGFVGVGSPLRRWW